MNIPTPDWAVWAGRLDRAGDDVDDVVNEVVSQALASPPDPAATALLIRALGLARSDLSRADAATALV